MVYKAEYIWIDGTEPTPKLRSKTKIITDGGRASDLGFRRLEHEPGHRRQERLRAEAGRRLPGPDPGWRQRARDVRGYLVDGKPHPTNTRAAAVRTAKKYKKHEPMFGIEQEFTL